MGDYQVFSIGIVCVVVGLCFVIWVATRTGGSRGAPRPRPKPKDWLYRCPHFRISNNGDLCIFLKMMGKGNRIKITCNGDRNSKACKDRG